MFHVSVFHARRKHPHTVYRCRSYDAAMQVLKAVMLAEDVTKVTVVQVSKAGTEHMCEWELGHAS